MRKAYGTLRVLRDVSFDLRRGEILVLLGLNGAGKSTLLEGMAGLVAMDAGTVEHIDSHGRHVVAPDERHQLLFLLPDNIVPWAEQTVGWMLSRGHSVLAGTATRPAIERARDIDETLAIDPIRGVRVGALSKGERKRALLALALRMPQPILVLDEPFDGLDLRMSRAVRALFRRTVEQGSTLLLSMHQLHDAPVVGDRMVLLHDGVIAGAGTMDELRDRAGLPLAALDEVFLALT